MILVDANLPLYAYDRSSPHHEAARRWFELALRGSEPVRFAWLTLLAFLRIATNPRAFARPLSLEEALTIVEGWLSLSLTGIIEPAQQQQLGLQRRDAITHIERIYRHQVLILG